jgi:hypothetical protein
VDKLRAYVLSGLAIVALGGAALSFAGCDDDTGALADLSSAQDLAVPDSSVDAATND